jgi:hypothetical protein
MTLQIIPILVSFLVGVIVSSLIRRWRDWPGRDLVAFCSMFIALLALILSISESRDRRVHESFSVRPRFGYAYYSNDTGAGWRLMNSGLGPARLRGFRMLVDGIPRSGFDDLIKALDLPLPVQYEFTNPEVGDWYKADHESVLFWIKSSAAAAKLRTVWPRVVLQACYCSIYKECWYFSSDALPDPTGDDPRDDDCSTFAAQEHNRWWMG